MPRKNTLKTQEKAHNTLTLLCVPLAGLIGLWLMGVVARGQVYSRLPFELLPLIPAFALWMRATNEHGSTASKFSPICCATSIILFLLCAGGRLSYEMRLLTAFAAVMAGLLVFVGLNEIWRRFLFEKRAFFLALFMGCTALIYFRLHPLLWEQISQSTSIVVHYFLSALGIDSGITSGQKEGFKGQMRRIIAIRSEDYVLWFQAACSGLDGIFMFLFLLSALVLIDWKVFKKISLGELYMIGIIYMFLVNAFRLSFLFLWGNASSKPDAGEFLQATQEIPFEIIHSQAGWIIYMIAFGLFATALYAYIRRGASA